MFRAACNKTSQRTFIFNQDAGLSTATENATVLNGEGRTAHGASISRHACVSVRAGCFPPFKAVVMFRCPLQSGSTKENTGLQMRKNKGTV